MKKLILKTATMKQLKTIVITAITAIFYFLPSFGGAGGGWAYAQVVGTPYIVPTIAKVEEPNFCTGTDNSTQGTDFWVTFGQNLTLTSIYGPGGEANALFMLYIAADEETDVRLRFSADNTQAIYHILDHSTIRIDMKNVDITGAITPADRNKQQAVYCFTNSATDYSPHKSKNTLHITSDKPVSVYAFNTGSTTTDATIVLPVSGWGTEYYNLSYAPIPTGIPNPLSFSIIIANQSTQVTTPEGIETLAEGEVYYRANNVDLTGRRYTADQPIAYFAHNGATNIPIGRQTADIILEQMLPVDKWGTQFLVPNAPEGPTNNMLNHIRIIASEQTKVNYSGATLVTGLGSAVSFGGSGGILNAGQWIELQINGSAGNIPNDTLVKNHCYITSDKPVGVAGYMVGEGGTASNGISDPSLCWIPPLSQLISTVTVMPFIFRLFEYDINTTLSYPISTHYMIITSKTDAKANTTISESGVNIVLDNNKWTDNATSGYSYYYHEFKTAQSVSDLGDFGKNFTVSNLKNGISVLMGGISYYESYYYNAGSGTCVVNP
ncbi:MAG: IgGFc-binding protein [Flavobacteriaceae bacterium]|jgi:hypothetical protein|nr:IgGFc-binding protein [Flavobacteriaceae bacterium]